MDCTNPQCIETRADRDRLREQYDILWKQYDDALAALEGWDETHPPINTHNGEY